VLRFVSGVVPHTSEAWVVGVERRHSLPSVAAPPAARFREGWRKVEGSNS